MNKCKNCGANEFAVYETIMHSMTHADESEVLQASEYDSGGKSLGIDFIECEKCGREHNFSDFAGVNV